MVEIQHYSDVTELTDGCEPDMAIARAPASLMVKWVARWSNCSCLGTARTFAARAIAVQSRCRVPEIDPGRLLGNAVAVGLVVGPTIADQ